MVLALAVLSGTLIAALMTSSTKRRAVGSSAAAAPPLRAPTTAPPPSAPTTAPPPKPTTWPVSTTQDVWLKTGPGAGYGNIVVLPGGAQGEVACYDPNGQVETSTDGSSSRTWWHTDDGQDMGWVSGDYLNIQGARDAPMC